MDEIQEPPRSQVIINVIIQLLISKTVLSYSHVVQYHAILYCSGIITQVLLHGPWGYVISYQPQCALIRIYAFKWRVAWYFV